jgi:hypothetical protein
MKVVEKAPAEKRVTHAQEAEEKAAIAAAGYPEYAVIRMLELLLDQNKDKPGLSSVWSFMGPADKLLAFMVEKNGGKSNGLPATGAELLRFLQAKGMAPRMRKQHSILVTIVPNPMGGRSGPGLGPSQEMREPLEPIVRVERDPDPSAYLPYGG